MKPVFVVMGNDYPAAVFDNAEAAQAFCDAQPHTPEAQQHRATFGGYRVHWRYYEFPLLREVKVAA